MNIKSLKKDDVGYIQFVLWEKFSSMEINGGNPL